MRAYKIAVAGAGYVGMAMAVLLSLHHQVTVVDIVPEKISMINRRQSPVRDDVMQQVLSHTPLHLSATLNAQAAYADADFVVIAVPTNYDDVDPALPDGGGGGGYRAGHAVQSGCGGGYQIHRPGRVHGVGAREIP